MHTKNSIRPLTIALFDSGIGGLSLLNPLLSKIPARYLYFADTAFLPYGNKTVEQLTDRCAQIVKFLTQQEADIIICACHTLSTTVLPTLISTISLPCISSAQLIIDGIKQESDIKTIGVIGTQATIKSQYFSAQLKHQWPYVHTIERTCPLLASWIEERRDETALAQLLSLYLQPIKQVRADALIIGCTHYTHVRHLIKKCLGNQIRLISAEEYTVDAVRKQIANIEHVADRSITFFSSLPEQSIAKRFAQHLPALGEHSYTVTATPVCLSREQHRCASADQDQPL